MKCGIAALLLAALIFIASTSFGMNIDNQQMLENSAICLDCHDDQEETLRHSVHRMTTEDDMNSPVAVGCTGCHRGWEEHLEDPAEGTIMVGPELGQTEQASICAGCHLTNHQASMLTSDPHGMEGLKCSDCHTIHSNPSQMLVKDDRENYCSKCHVVVAAEFKRRSVHPLESGNVRCSDCHELGKIKDHELGAGLDWTCQECHTDIAGPYTYEHPVTYNYLVEGQGCSECHHPHGSPNDKLLKQPESGTCLQCHMTPPGHRIAHAGLGARHACADCHSQVHGSYDNKFFLDPDLGMKHAVNCYASGCHSLDN